MENLYKLNEYSGKLPNPKSFPIQGATIIAIKDRPTVFADGFILDLSVKESDRKSLKERALHTIDISSINGFLEEARVSRLLLSEPEFIYDTTFPTCIVFTPEGNPIGIQVKYYRYFRNRYPKCKFYKKGENTQLTAIKVNEEVVGLCMPMYLELGSITKIKEESK